MEDDLPSEYDVIVVGTGIDFIFKILLIILYFKKFFFKFFIKYFIVDHLCFKILLGMTESIVAAAASRIGKKVLHLDR